MTENHPITPPPYKIHNWLQLEKIDCTLGQIITVAARWGADQELEACCELIYNEGFDVDFIANLRAARRPNPLSLKEQALKVLSETELRHEWTTADEDIIRRALEQLPDPS
jgi:hypothetical protein